MIIYRPTNAFKARFWGGGELPASLKGSFTSFKECEKAVINYLQSTDKWGKAIWPSKYE